MLGAFNVFGTRMMVRSPSATTLSAPQQPLRPSWLKGPSDVPSVSKATSVPYPSPLAPAALVIRRGKRTTLLFLDAQSAFPGCSSSKVTATAAFADKRTFLPSTSATSPKSMK
jgi:hypothetical protein